MDAPSICEIHDRCAVLELCKYPKTSTTTIPLAKSKKRKKRRRARSSGLALGGLYSLFIGGTVLCLLFVGLSFVWPLLSLLPLLGGIGMAFAGGIWFLRTAFWVIEEVDERSYAGTKHIAEMLARPKLIVERVAQELR